MKLTDWNLPKWEERKPTIFDKLLFIPPFYDHHEQEEVARSFFSKFFLHKVVYVEYCSGLGEWIIEKAKKFPEIQWIAVEKKFDRARRIWEKMQRENVDNLFVVLGEAFTFSKFYLPKESISCIFINFPDPWPKRRHEKHRIISDEFLQDISRTLVFSGEAIFVTDDEKTKEEMIKKSLALVEMKAAFPSPYFVTEWEGFGGSYFERRWRGFGKEIFYIKFTKTESALPAEPFLERSPIR